MRGTRDLDSPAPAPARYNLYSNDIRLRSQEISHSSDFHVILNWWCQRLGRRQNLKDKHAHLYCVGWPLTFNRHIYLNKDYKDYGYFWDKCIKINNIYYWLAPNCVSICFCYFCIGSGYNISKSRSDVEIVKVRIILYGAVINQSTSNVLIGLIIVVSFKITVACHGVVAVPPWRAPASPEMGGAFFSRVFEPELATIQIKNHLVYSSRRAVYRPYKLTVFTV